MLFWKKDLKKSSFAHENKTLYSGSCFSVKYVSVKVYCFVSSFGMLVMTTCRDYNWYTDHLLTFLSFALSVCCTSKPETLQSGRFLVKGSLHHCTQINKWRFSSTGHSDVYKRDEIALKNTNWLLNKYNGLLRGAVFSLHDVFQAPLKPLLCLLKKESCTLQ